MKTPSPFECAIRALRHETGETGPRVLAIDMDACAAALCVRDAGGAYTVRDGVRLDEEAQSPIRLYAGVTALLPGGSADEQALSRAWRRYIQSGRQEDPGFGGVSCAALETAFAPAAQLYGELFALADKLTGGDDVGILLFGRMAARALAVYAAHDYFSADPFLPDPLFITANEPETLAERGLALLQAEAQRGDAPFGRSISLILTSRGGGELPVALAHPNQSRDGLKTPVFGQSFCCRAGDSLAVEVDGARGRVNVPGELFADGAALVMVSAGFALDGQSAALHLRTGEEGSGIRIPLKLD